MKRAIETLIQHAHHTVGVGGGGWMESDMSTEPAGASRPAGATMAKVREPVLPREGLTAEAQAWLRENRAAMDEWNEYVERHGLPLAEYRQF